MKKLFALSLLSSVLFLCAGAFGQTVLTSTTLSTAAQGVGSVNGATPTGNLSIVTLTSATGVSAPSPNTSLTPGLQATSEAQTYLYVDRELMQVKAVSGTTVTVIRGVGGTSAPSHLSGAVVFIVPSAAIGVWSGNGFEASVQGPSAPQGSCTRTSELYLPRIHFSSGTISDCIGSQWVNGDASQTTRVATSSIGSMMLPNPGGTVYTSLNSTGTTLAATTMYCTELDFPFSKYVTGLAVLNGTTVGTDNHLVALYDNTGNLLANSATAGVLAATASEYQKISFTAPYYVVGPASYFGCMQTNGTTATVRMLVTQVQDTYLTVGVTGQTFGTIPATIAAPTAFHTAVGPYFAAF